MATCEVCGVEYDYPGEQIHLYSAKLIERKVSGRKMNTRTIASQYNQVKSITVTICKRHRRELVTQRIVPGIIVFVVVMVPVMFIISRLYPFQGSSLVFLYILSALIALFLTSRVLRLISLEGLVATALTIRDKRNGLAVEYLTPKKYERFVHPPEPGLRGLTRYFRTNPQNQNNKSPNNHSKRQ